MGLYLSYPPQKRFESIEDAKPLSLLGSGFRCDPTFKVIRYDQFITTQTMQPFKT
jgi:hypothetical protein